MYKRQFLDGRDKLVIGDHVDIASEVMIYNSEHDINASDFHAILAPVKVGNYTFIGPRSIILPDVEIGDRDVYKRQVIYPIYCFTIGLT